MMNLSHRSTHTRWADSEMVYAPQQPLVVSYYCFGDLGSWYSRVFDVSLIIAWCMKTRHGGSSGSYSVVWCAHALVTARQPQSFGNSPRTNINPLIHAILFMPIRISRYAMFYRDGVQHVTIVLCFLWLEECWRL
jgi:hypothetical protein